MEKHKILALAVNHRSKQIDRVQDLFTKYGCSIKARIGLHEAGDACSEEGLILLQLVPGEENLASFMDELNVIEGVRTKYIEL